jgi:hypothetical protein
MLVWACPFPSPAALGIFYLFVGEIRAEFFLFEN